jgi:hypothetical protein
MNAGVLLLKTMVGANRIRAEVTAKGFATEAQRHGVATDSSKDKAGLGSVDLVAELGRNRVAPLQLGAEGVVEAGLGELR